MPVPVSYSLNPSGSLPLALSSNDFQRRANYGLSYSKAGIYSWHLLHYLGEDVIDDIMHKYYSNWKFKHPHPSDYFNLIKQRSFGKPIAYLIKKKDFWKYEFVVNQDVLIPRPDTEILIEQVLELTKNKNKLNFLDIGVSQLYKDSEIIPHESLINFKEQFGAKTMIRKVMKLKL